MNEETTKLIQELAGKLGTTADHLWSVLIRQAPITAATELTFYSIAALVLAAAWVTLVRWLIKGVDDGEESAFWGTLILGALTLIFLLMLGSDASVILAGFFNPEYWALRQVMK